MSVFPISARRWRKAIDLDEDGGLLIRSDTGLVIKKMTGDVVQIN